MGKLKASTLVESIVAIAMITLILAMGIRIFASESIMHRQSLLLKADILASEMLGETIENKLFIDEEKKQDGYTISKHCSDSNLNANLIIVTISVTIRERKILEKKMLFKVYK